MSESGDYDPGVWKGYDFKSARAKYDVHVGRSYDDAVKTDKKVDDLVPLSVKSESDSPVVICCDVTGSMGEWPATIFSKLPYLDLEGKEYLGEKMEVSFAAVGDCFSDKYPLQVHNFVAGKAMEEVLQKLVVEGGGGGQTTESYDLAALYYSRNCQIPNAIRPIFVLIGDEGPYQFVDKTHGETWGRTTIEGRIGISQIFEELKKKFSVYLVRKPYDRYAGDKMSTTDTRIQKEWEELLGADHVTILPDASRVVDVIFGIFAKETGRGTYFKEELEGRQTPEQVDTVLKSLSTMHVLPEPDEDADKADEKDSKGKTKPAKSKAAKSKGKSVKASKKAGKSMKKLPTGASITRRKDEGKDSVSLI